MHIVASVLCLIAVLCLISDSVVSASEGVDVAVEVEELIDSMVLIPGGTFRMGDGAGSGHSSQRPVHEVAIRSFMLGRQEVTFAQWDACVFDGGCGSYRPDDRGWGRGMRPVVNVAWEDVQAFIVWLNARTGGGYRLPTEAEWEYAARAGTLTEYAWGDATGHNRANCDDCGSQWDDEQTAPVGRFPANAWGLHDMHGNVDEWLTDCWHENYKGAPDDGSAWVHGGDCGWRVMRGGAYAFPPDDLRSASRGWATRLTSGTWLGFRVAQDK